MSKGKRLILVIIGLGLMAGLLIISTGGYTVRKSWPQTEGNKRVGELLDEVSIYRDSWGVPYIYASNIHDLFFAQGYVQAQDRFWQMEFQRRLATGRLSEVLGEATLDSDKFIRTVGLNRAAERDWESVDEETRQVLEAYSEGVNAYINDHSNSLGLEFQLLSLIGNDFTPETWTPVDTIAWSKMMAWDLGGNMGHELLRARIYSQLGEKGLADFMPLYPDQHPLIIPNTLSEASFTPILAEKVQGYNFGDGEGVGSNNWVISGDRTDTGSPLLANDVHLNIQAPSIWYEVGLYCETLSEDCPYHVAGASLPGAPGIVIGRNRAIAWGVTNMGPDVQDLYIERINPQNRNQYEYKGGWLDMELVREEVYIADQEDPLRMIIRLTQHGPIINDIVGGTEDEWTYGWQPLSLDWVGFEAGTLIKSVLLLNRAQNWETFQEALSYWDLPGQNFVYADVEGNIGYQAAGKIPIRTQGNGSMPVYGWTGEYEWMGYIPFDEMPSALNPSDGYIVTANNAIIDSSYPYFITIDWDPGYRADRIVTMIEEDPVISMADMQLMQADTNSSWVALVLPYLTELESNDPILKEGLQLLDNWDGLMVRDSSGAALMQAMRGHIVSLTFEDELGTSLMNYAPNTSTNVFDRELPNANSPWFDNIHTPEIETRDVILLQALQAAIDELSASLGEEMSNWRWGDLHTATFVNQSLGLSGIGLVESIFNRGPFAANGSNDTVNSTAFYIRGSYEVLSIPAYRQIIDLNQLDQSVSIYAPGQSGHPYHPHYDDLIDPWLNDEYHAMLWELEDIENNYQDKLVLHP